MKIETALRPANWLYGLTRSARVDGIVPAGFEGYLRIFHKARPAEAEEPGTGAAPHARWEDVASALGRRLSPETLWADLSGAYGEPASAPGMGTVYPPEEGRLDAAGFRALARVLAREANGPLLAAFWTGWDPISADSEAARAIRRGDTVVIQGEQYVLYSFESGELADGSWMGAAAFGWAEGNGLTPNYMWPADSSWCLGTNIDLDSSILGGPARVLSEVESLPELEALRVTSSTDLASSAPKAR
jgi:hypothetical protein